MSDRQPLRIVRDAVLIAWTLSIVTAIVVVGLLTLPLRKVSKTADEAFDDAFETALKVWFYPINRHAADYSSE